MTYLQNYRSTYFFIFKILTRYHVNLRLVAVSEIRYRGISILSTFWFQQIKLQTTLLLFDGSATLIL